MIGGIMGLLTICFSFFISPFSKLEFVIENQSKREEINLVVAQSLCEKSVKDACH